MLRRRVLKIMSTQYEGNEQNHWEDRIDEKDRYSSVGISGLPDNVNRYRKEALFDVIEQVFRDEKLDPSDLSVLDAGCGTGIYSEFYARKGAQVSGIDISETAIQKIREYNIPGVYEKSTLNDIPFSDGEFDLAHAFSVLYHIVDDTEWRQSLQELERVTKPGGYLLLRIGWVDETDRKSDHLKHRSRERYKKRLIDEGPYTLKKVYTFEDVVRFQKLFVLLNKVLPKRASEKAGTLVDTLSLLSTNQNQKVVVFEKTK